MCGVPSWGAAFRVSDAVIVGGRTRATDCRDRPDARSLKPDAYTARKRRSWHATMSCATLRASVQDRPQMICDSALTRPGIRGKILVCVFGHSSTTHAEES